MISNVRESVHYLYSELLFVKAKVLYTKRTPFHEKESFSYLRVTVTQSASPRSSNLQKAPIILKSIDLRTINGNLPILNWGMPKLKLI